MKKVGKVLIVLILLLVITAGALAYAYFYTDLFKSNKEIFFTYIMKNGDVVSLFNEPGIAKITEKEMTQKYAVSSKIDVEYPADKKFDDLNIVLNGKTDVQNNKYDYEINLNYNETVGMPYRIVVDGKAAAITSSEVITNFIGIKNENLKDLATKFGIDATEIPDKFEFEMPDYTKYYLTENEKIVVNYKDLITNKFMEENFTKSTSDDGATIYTLTTSTNMLKELSINLLEAAKGENLIINKIVEIVNDISKEEQITAEDIIDSIDEMITEMKETEVNEKEIKVNVYVANKELVKTEVVAEGLNLTLIANKNKLEYDIKTLTDEDNARVIFSMDKTRTDDNLKYVVATKFFNEDIEIFNLDIDYAINGIDTLNKVTLDTNISGKLVDFNSEEYTHYTNVMQDLALAEFYASNEEFADYAQESTYTEADLETAKQKLKEVEMLSAGVKVSTTSDFTTEVTFDELNETNFIALNDYEYDVLVSVFSQIATQFTTVHDKKLQEAGLESDPYFILPTIIGTGMYIYNSSSSSLENAMDSMDSMNQNQADTQMQYDYDDYDYDYEYNTTVENYPTIVGGDNI